MSGYMTTVTGREYQHAAPTADMVDIYDIAHALSMLCHWNGHSAVFFSVAQHSVLVSHLCPPDLAMWGLLHDAAEAYYGDMIRPLKVLIPEYRVHEERGMRVIAEKFHLSWPEPPTLKPYDNLALALEADAYMPQRALHDGHGGPVELAQGVVLPYGILAPRHPVDAREMFLNRYATLLIAAPKQEGE